MNGPLPTDLYRAASVRELDRVAIEEIGIPGAELMERAGAAALRDLRERWPGCAGVGVLCGGGNNAGDGYVLARRARAQGLAAHVLEVGDPGRLRGAAHEARARFVAAGGEARPWEAAGSAVPGDVLVDALFGTGLDREVGGRWRAAIEALNAAGRPVVAIDVPSGLAADTGRVLGVAVRAALTVTFIGLKQGMFTGRAREHCGCVRFDDLGVPPDVYARVRPDARRVGFDECRGLLGERARAAHKGRYGHVLVVGGDEGYAGAALLAGAAAARSGAGLTSIATRRAHAAVIVARRPELMSRGVETPAELAPLLARASVLALGPGLGRGEWGVAQLRAAVASPLPAVVDADALNGLAAGDVGSEWSGRADRVYTPHPGEAARLLGCSASEVESDRFAAVAELADRHAGVWVLKGAGTLVAGDSDPIAVCEGGNPGMASGGMGDVLSGVVAALLAQGLPARRAAEAGVCLHAAAADRAARGGERGLIASDLLPWLRRLASRL